MTVRIPFFFFLYTTFAIAVGYSQSLNMTLLDHWDPGGLGFYNDIWGYTHSNSKEYVIAGSSSFVHFIELRASKKLVEKYRHAPGNSSIWRDFKTYGSVVYGVADQGTEGLAIYDLSNLPATIVFVDTIKTDFSRAHNCYVDVPNAKLYVCGSNSVNQGMIVYDLTDPLNPILVGSPLLNNFPLGPPSNRGYVHDLFVQDNIVYASHGHGGYYIWDFSLPNSPVLLGGLNPETGYNHSSWITTDNNHVIFAEEVSRGRPLTVLDISDLNDLNIIHTFKNPLLAPTYVDNTPHNPYIIGDMLYVSYYEDGVQIWDISDLMSPIRVAYYDTEPNNTSYHGTTNNWGVYPFLSDDKVIASDRQNGIFLLQMDMATLPLEFIDFNVQKKSEGISLNWQTISEINVDYFIVEKSVDGVNFVNIHQEIANNQIEINEYTFIDESPHFGDNYYRIVSVDFDNSLDYTDIKSVNFERQTTFEIFPNPASGILSFSLPRSEFSTNRVLRVHDYSGRTQIESSIPTNSPRFQLNSFLPQGLYIIDIIENGKRVFSEKLLILP